MRVPAVAVEQITGVVLAGGQGQRMGGVDKGLLLLHGQPLAQHALHRLAPQVGTLMISANRHLAQYSAWGAPCHADTPIASTDTASATPASSAAFAGPLAGFLTGLQHARTPFIVTVPCDTPGFPVNLVARLAQALATNAHPEPGLAQIAMACTAGADGRIKRQPVFCLMRRAVAPSLLHYLQSGGRKVGQWAAQQGCVDVVFDNAQAFFNANTAEDLAHLSALPLPR